VTPSRDISRRRFIQVSTAAAAALVARRKPWETSPGRGRPAAGYYFLEPDSTFFSTASTEYAASYNTASDGDLWPSAWADDDNIYAGNGDGTGFSNPTSSDIVVNRLSGRPETGITGTSLSSGDAVANIWASPSEYNRKPTGMVAVDGDHDGRDELYIAVQDLRYSPGAQAFNDAPNASISRSPDYGLSWQKTSQPMFTDHVFTTIFFLDFGQSQRHARVLGPYGAAYVYAYGLDNNWRDSYSNTVASPTDLYLARAPRGSIQDRASWEFFTGNGPANRPRWGRDINARAAVLHDARRIYPRLFTNNGPTQVSVVSQGGVVYNAPLDRYIYTSWAEYTFEFYEAPAPWGPWRLFMTKDAGGYPWYGTPTITASCPGPKNGGYATTVPSKFISDDGKDMWAQSNWWVNDGCGSANYCFSLRKFRVAPYGTTTPRNPPSSADNLARTGAGVNTIEKSAHYGHGSYYNNGVKDESEDSFDGSPKPLDFWGYTFDREYYFDRVVYTTGRMYHDGGWFRSGLRAQVRRQFQWVDVDELSMTPPYPYDDTAGPHNSYTLRFKPVAGDGIRILGVPGGEHNFTSIGELELYYGPAPGAP
jgi:hypothetical protein